MPGTLGWGASSAQIRAVFGESPKTDSQVGPPSRLMMTYSGISFELGLRDRLVQVTVHAK